MTAPTFIYWRHAERRRNFGDALTELYRARLLRPDLPADSGVYFLVGSVLDRSWLSRGHDHARRRGGRACFWTCGWRGEPVTQDLLDAVDIAAVRGPITRTGLGLPADLPIGDSAMLLPLLHEPPRSAIRHDCLLVPHFADPRRDRMLARPQEWGADAAASPVVRNLREMVAVIDAVARSRLVLAGAMHAAVAALAYGVPFVFFRDGFLDCPAKWDDLAASMGCPPAFASHRSEARPMLEARAPPLRPLLDACPLPVRPEVLRRASALA